MHSRYNPRLEAEKYINALNLQGAEYLILIEPGLGYMIPLLREKYPRARIIALHVEDQGRAAADEILPDTSGAASWSPESGIGVQEFLAEIIGDKAASAVRIIEWRPALIRYGEPYLKLLSAAAGFIKQSEANFRTVKGFGRRWFRNFLKNLRLLHYFPIYEKLEVPMVITGSGPGLEESIPLIAEMKQREHLFVLAASSGVQTLLCRGIVPDLILSTDGGSWALLHLYECLRGTAGIAAKTAGITAGSPPVIAAALSAALPSQCANVPLLAISDSSFWQNLILRRLNIPHIPLVQRGTVTASAIDLALALSSGKVLIAGMDLAVRDIRTHVRPYSFDRLQAERASRLNPVYSQTYVRAAGITGGGSHQIYASWFGSQLKAYPGRLYTLGSNNQVFQGLKEWKNLTAEIAEGTEGGRREEPLLPNSSAIPVPSVVDPPSSPRIEEVGLPEDPAAFAVTILKEVLSDPRTKIPVTAELSGLLFPGREEVGAAELTDEINVLAGPYCGSNPAEFIDG
ncbi:hypothetical protein FACS189491_10600 [Spirochaetia bacterium]|nr:hypothetical protein FACS189491_10600 [Spirochaetia bacterium]